MRARAHACTCHGQERDMAGESSSSEGERLRGRETRKERAGESSQRGRGRAQHTATKCNILATMHMSFDACASHGHICMYLSALARITHVRR